MSCTPGAEGAPGLALVCEGCAFAGTMRRDWERWLAGSEAAGFGIHGLYHFELVVATKEQYGVRDVSTGVMEMWNGGWRELGAAFCWNSSLQVVASEAALEALSSSCLRHNFSGERNLRPPHSTASYGSLRLASDLCSGHQEFLLQLHNWRALLKRVV